MVGFLRMVLDNLFGMKGRLREESEVLRGVLQNSEEIDESLTDDNDDVVSDNESKSDE